LTPVDRPVDQHFQRTDRPATWGVVTIDGVDVAVGVGEPDPQNHGRPTERSGHGGSAGPTEVAHEGAGFLREPDEPCSVVTVRVHVPVPDGGRVSEGDPTGESTARARADWRIDLVLDAVIGADDAVIDCADRGTGEPRPPTGARCGPLPDPGITEYPLFPDRPDHTPGLPEPVERPEAVYFEAEAWDGFPIYVGLSGDLLCIKASSFDNGGCTGGPPMLGRAIQEVADPETGDPGGVVFLRRYPEGTETTEVIGADGPLDDAVITVAPDGEWFVAWVPHPYTSLRLDGDGPIVHRDADGEPVDEPGS
ncbi:MAG TPA: hypothetical protein VF228_13455, partial [Iamia sp.]